MTENQNKKLVWPVVLLAIFVGAIISISFFKSTQAYEITKGLLAAIVLLVAVCLSLAFDEINIVKVLSLKREVKKQEHKAEVLEIKNERLVEQILNLSLKVNQTQSTVYNQGLSADSIRDLIQVVKADGDKKEEAPEADQQVVVDPQNSATPLQASPEQVRRTQSYEEQRRVRSKIERAAIKSYMDRKAIEQSSVVLQVRITDALQYIDPIMDRAIVFDGYIKTPAKDLFIEVMHGPRPSILWHDRLYVYLSQVLHYRRAKNVDASLVLIIVIAPMTETEDDSGLSRLQRMFKPALESGLLTLEVTRFSQEDVDRIGAEEQGALL